MIFPSSAFSGKEGPYAQTTVSAVPKVSNARDGWKIIRASSKVQFLHTDERELAMSEKIDLRPSI